MKCAECRDLLSPYLDGELKDDERARVAQHLAACDACRHELAALRRLGEFVRNHAPEADPGDSYHRALFQRVMARIESLPVHTPAKPSIVSWLFSRWSVRLAGGLAVATAILLLALRFGLPFGASTADVAPSDKAQNFAAEKTTVTSDDKAVVPQPGIQTQTTSLSAQAEQLRTLAATHHTPRAAPQIAMVPAPVADLSGAGGIAGNAAEGAASQVKPARGGMETMSRLHAARAEIEFQKLFVLPEMEPDSATRSLREREMLLRREIAASTDSSSNLRRERDLAALLYHLAARTKDPRDINRALLFWRPAYDRLALAFGDSLARARMTHLEHLVLGESGE